MKYTEIFKTIAKKGHMPDIDKFLFEMPPVTSAPWVGLSVTNQAIVLPPNGQGPFADINDNIDFIVELMKGNTANKEEVVKRLISSMTQFQSESNVRTFLDLLNHKLNADKPQMPLSNPYTISSWAIENAPFMLDMPIFQQDLYEAHVREMVLQAINNNDAEALQNLMARHAHTLPDQVQPSMIESMKSYIPMWVKTMISSPQLSWLIGERVKFELCSSIDNPNTSFEIKSILAPYSIEQKVLGSVMPHNNTTTSKEIASDIAKYKLTDNPRAMRALRISQLIDAAMKGEPKAFREKLAEVKDVLDEQALYKIFNSIMLPAIPLERAKVVMAEELLQATQPLYEDNSAGLAGLWEQFLERGHTDLLKVPGVLPDEISFRDLKQLIKTNAEKPNVEVLDILLPYVKQQNVSILFGDGELNINHLSKNDIVAVLERLDNLTIATKRPPSLVSSYQKSTKGKNVEVEPEEQELKTKHSPKK